MNNTGYTVKLTPMPKQILALFALASIFGLASGHAETEKKTTPGNGPNGVPQATFFSHRLGADHAEGITTMDMNGDGYTDILSGAYWYENPGPKG